MKKAIYTLLGVAILLSGLLGSVPAQQSVFVPATTNTISVTGTVAAVTKIVTGVSGKSIYVTSISLVPALASTVTFTTGTGTNCATGTSSLSGAMQFASGQGYTVGSGYGTVMVVPQGNDLCITIATAPAPGTISYSIF